VYTIELDIFRSHIPAILEDSLRGYTRFKDPNSLKPGLGDLLETVSKEIEEENPVNIDPARYSLLSLILVTGFREDIVIDALNLVFNRVDADSSLTKKSLRDNFKRYHDLSVNSVINKTYLTYDASLWDAEQYQYSETKVTLTPKQIDKTSRAIYTLYSKSRLWSSYSPNKLLKDLLSKFDLSYEPTVVYNNKVYTSESNKKINYERFSPEEWIAFKSKYLNEDQKFNRLLSSALNSTYRELFNVAKEINAITSDSKIHTPQDNFPLSDGDIEGLVNTFGGGGKLIFNKARTLLSDCDHFGGYQGSIIGGFDYMSEFATKVKECARCESTSPDFGQFSNLFLAKSELGRIPGLKFLEPLGRTKSFNQGLTIPPRINISQGKITFNPIHAKFYQGLNVNNSITFLKNEDNSYKFSPEYDPLSLSLKLLLQKSCILGDNILSMIQAIDQRGRIPGYECLGSVEYQLKELQKSFPSSARVRDLGELSGGMGGSAVYFKNAYDKFISGEDDIYLPEGGLQELKSWLVLLSRNVKELHKEFSAVGIKTNGVGLLPNIETKKYNPTSGNLVQFLSRLGFGDSEINNLLKVKSLDELITNFAPISDSSDLKSFFRGYELAQIIAEFAGDSGIDAYIEFLYSKSTIETLLNILNITLKNPSKQTFIQTNRYPKLIGLLVSLTYAINPDQLSKFSSLLENNKLSLLESVAYVLGNSTDRTVLKNKEEIDILGGVIDQVIRGNYTETEYSPDLKYPQAPPVLVKSWTNTLKGSLGNVDPEKIYHLYDKISGMTPKELIVVLNNPSPTSSIGQLIDGFYGGNFTKFLKYATLSGLALKLSVYKNSSQLSNKHTDFEEKFYTFPALLDGLEKLYQAIDFTASVVDIKTSGTVPSNNNVISIFNSLFSAQNKAFQALSDVIQNGELSGNYAPQESPGTGNSRLPNRAEAVNSISPEQASLILSTGQVGSLAITHTHGKEPFTDGFIKFTNKNKFLNNINHIFYSSSGNLPERQVTTEIPAADKTTPEILKRPVINSGPGKNYLASHYNSPTLSVAFNAYDSCKKFGGSDCDSIYPESTRNGNNLCVPDINKSFIPQESTGNVSNNNLVKIDRALGYFSDYLPSSGSIISKRTPAYYGVFKTNSIQIGPGSEPLTQVLPEIDYTAKGGIISEYANSKFAINKFLANFKKEINELTCASLSSLHDYQLCMNVLKCKKTDKKLNFCPSTLKGGIN